MIRKMIQNTSGIFFDLGTRLLDFPKKFLELAHVIITKISRDERV